MKKRIILAICISICSLLSLSQKRGAGFTSVGPVKSTKSMAVWIRGENMQINWTGGNPAKNVYLTLILREPFSVKSVIAADIDNTGKFTWMIPDDTVVGVYEVYICDDAVKPDHWRYSQDFVIEAKDYTSKSARKAVVVGAQQQ